MFISQSKIANDYLLELAQSMLLSWDRHQVETTKKYDELRRRQVQERSRSVELLREDDYLLNVAAANQWYTEDAQGLKYKFSRSTITDNIKAKRIADDNIDRIAEVFREFLRW